MKYFIKLFSLSFIISIFYSIVHDFSSYSFINSSFTIGMIYFLFGCLFFVWERGFFNLTIYSFNKIQQQIQKHRGFIENGDIVNLDSYINRTNNFYLTNYLLICGAFICTISTIISFVYI